MSNFIDSEAEESEHEGEEEEEEEIGHVRKYKSNKDKRKKQIDSDEEEEDDDEEVVKDLIDDNPIEEDSDNESAGSRKRKKSDEEDDFDDRLEEDDYDLLEENLGMKVKRKKGFKRIRQDEESDVEDTQEQGDDREAIANQLFEGSDNENERPSRRDEAPEQYASDESEVESETDDFIVDDDGQPIAEKRKKRKPIFTDAALQEAQDIFGVDFDYEDLDKEEEEEYDEEDEEDEDEYENEEQHSARRTKKALRRKKKLKSLYELYEPHELERAGITEEDNRIRNTDIPERMQLRVVPITPADEDELEEEAEWIFKMGFSKHNFAAIVDKPKVGEITPAPQSDWGDDWDKQSGIAVPGPAASVVASTVSKPGAISGEEDWEENWEKASSIVSAAPKSTLSAKQGGGIIDDDDNWERESNFEKQSVIGGPKSRVGDSDGILPGAKSHISMAASGAPEKSIIQIMEEAKPKVVAKIRKALEFMRNQHLEVPFIVFYRKEYIQPELKINDLWKIYKLDGRYCQLKLRKTRLSILFKNMQMYQTDLIMENPDEPISDAVRIISEDDIDRIRNLKTSEELKDMYLLFSLYYADDVQLMKEAMVKKRLEDPDESDSEPIEFPSTKRKIGGGSYALCKKLGIDSLVKKFGLTPDRFAENLRDLYQRYEVEQYHLNPLDTAKEYVNQRLKTQEEALKAAKFMLATQLSREPLVRLSVREVFFERATITVTPTKKGLREIDEAHPCYAMKYIKGKPVRDLKHDQFLKLTIAEEDKLINLVIGDQIKGITGDTYVEEVVQLFSRDEFSKLVQEWNDVRAECCQFALEKLLYPIFRKELRAKLLDEAKEYVIDTATHKLNEWLKVAPYSVNFAEEDEEDWDTSKGIRVLAIAYVPDFSQASFATVISPDGEPSEFIRLQNIMKSLKAFNESDRKDKAEDLRSIKELIVAKKPHVVVIGGESRDAIMIKEDIRNLIADLGTEDGFPSINVEIVDNELAKVYASSIKAQTDFREFPLILRQAISLGRRMQDPLIEFSQLVNHDDEILCLRLHPMQDQVAKEELLESLSTQFVNRTNEVGVDLNRCISSPFSMNVAQFICGLGPRKATALVKILKQNNQRLENRTQLITVCHMGPKIFINCSGFIKIDTNSLGDSTEAYVEVLDGSRVHPETYEWARKMAVDALEYDDEDSNPASALEEILENPKCLEELNLDAFASELERQGFGNKRITLYDIRVELNYRYEDHREPYTTPNAEQLFNMLTKETPETLYIGKLTTATVVGVSYKKPQGDQLDDANLLRNEETEMWQCAFCMKNDFPDLSDVWNHFDAGACPGQASGIRIRLDNGISGFIPIGKLSDKPVTNPNDRVKRGQTIHCRIVKLEVERFNVECTSRTSDLVDFDQKWRLPKDPYYDAEAEDKDKKQEEEVKKKKHYQPYVRRVIVHPAFKNISFKELVPILETMDQGDLVIRPSSKGSDHLTVTWKVTDSICQHIDVLEIKKENMFSLGRSLLIGSEEYEDLDEIIARCVNPMASHSRELVSYKYYVRNLGGSLAMADEYLNEERKKNSNKIHYVLHASKEFPGKFLLSYLPGNKVQHEYITVTPSGFRYRQQSFASLNALLNWFKEHYRDAPPSAPVATPTIARTSEIAAQRGMLVLPPPPPSSHFTLRTTPHYTTPAQGLTPYSAFTTPYTPTAQTPYMTPYQTPYSRTPMQSNPQTRAPFVNTSDGFNNSGQKFQQQTNMIRVSRDAQPNDDGSAWRKAADAWAKSQQRRPQRPPDSQKYDDNPNFQSLGSRPKISDQGLRSSMLQLHQKGEGVRGEQNAYGSSAHNFLPNPSHRSGGDSLKSTPHTNFTPRSMVESSSGDETPLYDEK